jgi:ribonuclease Y
MILVLQLIFIILVFALSFGAAFMFVKIQSGANITNAEQQGKELLLKAKKEGEAFAHQSQEQVKHFQESFAELEKRYQNQVQKSEKTLASLEERFAQKDQSNQKIQSEIELTQLEVIKLDGEIIAQKNQTAPLLAKICGYSLEKIKEELLNNLAMDLELAHETRLSKIVDYHKEQAPFIAKNLLIGAIHRYSASTSVEKKSLIIPINRNETKAKIIGNNAEIINFLESELGVDIVFDDSKPGISVSHFELVKKHLARETILKLIKDRVVTLEIASKRLEEAKVETKALLTEIGNKVVAKLDLEYRKFPPEFKEILGRLKYRTSYGQNILKHCFEVGYFTLLLGNELGLSEEICKIGGFFHDLGKAIDQEDGRPHDILTKEIMERFGIFSWEEVHAAWTHHDAIPIETAEALLVKAGDAISAGRPGARQETIEKYLARVMAIESIARSYEGVAKTYAISGGRELRVLVDPVRLGDSNLPELATEIAREIEQNVAYPGQIRVNVIRRIQQNRTIKEKAKPPLK